ncbi:phage virion morphogenesis protein [Campylobacter geochelonis]|uniref:Phage virion morphogenesis protein n=1 Tax=Campylobacter geochelonis TaxID=1780362 RepID=A0A128EJX2_9BACT|nr:phage virion morphogenesis protein [Campylobacter geochelonis]QKF71173.1 putative phage virion morphogenesis protein [Campylobacter geochelonis]CZE48513.1 phage virion morphogenesis protein [Campylobacter geochelonis]
MPIKVEGFDEVIKKLQNLQALEVKTKPLMSQIGNTLKNSITDSFNEERSPFGEKWKALKPSTIKQKEKKNKSNKILRRDGALADKWLVKSSNKDVTVSNNTNLNGFAYGLTHQFGSSSAGRNKRVFIPARVFLPIDKNNKLEPNLKEDLKDLVVEFVKSNV